MTILNPAVWSWDRLKLAAAFVGGQRADQYWPRAGGRTMIPVLRIGFADLRIALAKGMADFAANRSDVLFLCAVYPVVGLVLARLAVGTLLPMLFPLVSGFALLGPLAGVGLCEMSRRRENGQDAGWAEMFQVLRSPSIGAITLLGLLLIGVFGLWLAVAALLYRVTLGPALPLSLAGFLHDVFTTQAGWELIGLGTGLGFLFAVLVLMIGVVSFPLLLDADVGIETAIRTSIRAVWHNKRPMAAWGFIVALGLVIGSLPLLLGLVAVLPILGHATWHLYRRVIPA